MNIAAISTPSGIGGIAVIRVSGLDSIELCSKVFRPFKAAHALDTRQTHTLTFGQIIGKTTLAEEEIIDEVVVSVFRAPHSFTGENVVEISCHGSTYIQQRILETLLSYGIRLAEPGEFTRRAFQNGKLDLSQAEAVADLIASNNAAAHRLAMSQMKGVFSRKLYELREKLLELSSLLELELDFSEEDVEFADRLSLISLADEIHHSVSSLAASFQTGDAIRNGVPVAIIGETNAGKSTLLNYLLNDDKAIVSDIHGTTRDVIEDTTMLNGTLLRFIDTAGIRETDDIIENLGIERTYQRISQAAVILWVIDGSRLANAKESENLANDAQALYRLIESRLNPNQKIIIVVNKSDLVEENALANNSPRLKETLSKFSPYNIYIMCAHNDEDLNGLKRIIAEATAMPEVKEGDIIVTNLRHYTALAAADEAILRVSSGLASGLSGDFIAQDLRECGHHIGTIVGEVSTDEILGTIFSRFCIGK